MSRIPPIGPAVERYVTQPHSCATVTGCSRQGSTPLDLSEASDRWMTGTGWAAAVCPAGGQEPTT